MSRDANALLFDRAAALAIGWKSSYKPEERRWLRTTIAAQNDKPTT
jgi:hypothetical protein